MAAVSALLEKLLTDRAALAVPDAGAMLLGELSEGGLARHFLVRDVLVAKIPRSFSTLAR